MYGMSGSHRGRIFNDIPADNIYDLVMDYHKLEKLANNEFQKLMVSILRRIFVLLIGTPSLNNSAEDVEEFKSNLEKASLQIINNQESM